MKWQLVNRYVSLGLLLASTGACSFVLVRGPPDGYGQMESFSCTESGFVPVLDLVGAASSVIGAATAEDEPGLFEGGSLWAWDRETQIAIGVAGGVALATSAVVGFRRVDRCRAALAELTRRSEALALRRVGHQTHFDRYGDRHSDPSAVRSNKELLLRRLPERLVSDQTASRTTLDVARYK